MGTWGPGLYSDDTALDIREEYRDLLGEGVHEPEATLRMLDQWKDGLQDADFAPVFWLTLADTQWNVGRLQPRVRTEALAVIEGGTDLQRWQADAAPEFVAKRRLVLERLRQKLQSQPPAEKKVRKRFVDSTVWEVGDVYSYRLRSGSLVLLRVLGFHQDRGGRAPICEVLDWSGQVVPDQARLRRLGPKRATVGPLHQSQFLFGSVSRREYPKDRLRLEAKGTRPRQRPHRFGIVLWRNADRDLEVLFGWR
jgi:hypothetical protein